MGTAAHPLSRQRASGPGRWAWAATLLVALVLPGGAAGALPREGVLVAGKSLGGVSVGMSKSQVEARWGSKHGRCRNCFRETWYFTYRPFQPQGAAVEFERGRVYRLYTLWQPAGWRTGSGLELGAWDFEVTNHYGHLVRQSCGRYTVQLLKGPRVWTVFSMYSGKVWGFGLTRAGTSPCV